MFFKVLKNDFLIFCRLLTTINIKFVNNLPIYHWLNVHNGNKPSSAQSSEVQRWIEDEFEKCARCARRCVASIMRFYTRGISAHASINLRRHWKAGEYLQAQQSCSGCSALKPRERFLHSYLSRQHQQKQTLSINIQSVSKCNQTNKMYIIQKTKTIFYNPKYIIVVISARASRNISLWNKWAN